MRVFITALLGSILAVAHLPGASLAFVPSSQTIALNEIATVDVLLEEPMGSLIGALNVSTTFDPGILSLTSVNFGSALGDPDDLLQTLVGSSPAFGAVDVFEVSFLLPAELGVLQDGISPVPLFSLTFQAIGFGVSPLDVDFALISDELGSEVGVTSSSGSIEVVPEPNTVALLALGLAGVWMVRRRAARSA